jgi:hypothetical protein
LLDTPEFTVLALRIKLTWQGEAPWNSVFSL